MTYRTTITRERCINGSDVEFEFEIDIEYAAHKAHRGHRDKYGAPEEPDEDAYIEIESATDVETGNEIELTKKEEEKFEIEISESLSDL